MGSQVPGTEAAHSLDGGIRVGGGGVLFICCWQNLGLKLERRKRQTPSREGLMADGEKVKDHTPIQAADAGPGQSPTRLALTAREKRQRDRRTDDVRTAGVGACVSVLLSRTWSGERYQLRSSTGRRRVGCHQAAPTGRKPSWTPGPSRSTHICPLPLSAPTSIDEQSPGMASFLEGEGVLWFSVALTGRPVSGGLNGLNGSKMLCCRLIVQGGRRMRSEPWFSRRSLVTRTRHGEKRCSSSGRIAGGLATGARCEV